jgi:hypothetical protein
VDTTVIALDSLLVVVAEAVVPVEEPVGELADGQGDEVEVQVALGLTLGREDEWEDEFEVSLGSSTGSSLE